jgi:hypothetical protein
MHSGKQTTAERLTVEREAIAAWSKTGSDCSFLPRYFVEIARTYGQHAALSATLGTSRTTNLPRFVEIGRLYEHSSLSWFARAMGLLSFSDRTLRVQ